ncbi:DNA primase [Jannaschia pagri]|uniref:DNA primase n=1 Tax=Jannaschia pagri TaxID=2829797 RepID=A0ABQ4NIK9_9RHOB|nr:MULTISPECIES: DNA primase [unclassified Jannaschia]GIT89966.1 DNA primase [Jannaschia sp. AI_61]GIT93927.1 DNA primase [Jannaschia sp. AI_62]
MRLPDSFFDEIRNRLSLSQVVGRKVVWDMRKTNQAKGDWWAPCPFHQEKSASFHVVDDKGYYYCFGCQAKGNIFKFVQETENVSFMESVEILAREAGLPMPARDPKAAEVADRRTELAKVTEAATKWFRLQLNTGAAAEARAYLDRRGLHRETVERFEIGFAPSTSDALIQDLTAKGIPYDMLEATGLAVTEDGRGRRDRFINRIIFPIRDARDRVIGFGGRAMNPNARAKYLNSPETELFDKGANLYNLRAARQAAGKGHPFVVAEGYMDVIALHQAGFEAAVAPLGTAVTERQLAMMWKVTPEPLIALDGDAAGQKAGLRVADLSLPLIAAGQSLRFAVLPQGQDPDDLIRAEGPSAMQRVLDGARSMLSLLWAREIEGKSFDSPERRAMLDRDLRSLLGRIKDSSLRKQYRAEVARKWTELFDLPFDGSLDPSPSATLDPTAYDAPTHDGVTVYDATPAPTPRPRIWRDRHTPAPAKSVTRNSPIAQGSLNPDTVLEQVALAGLVLHPALLEEFTATLEDMTWSTDQTARIALALLDVPAGADTATVRREMSQNLDEDTLDRLLAQPQVSISPIAKSGATSETARRCILDVLNRLAARRGVDRERHEAIEDIVEGADEGITWRLAESTRWLEAANKPAEGTEDSLSETSNAAHYDSLLATPKGKTRKDG